MKKLNRKGFTLIELLAVIVILAIVLVVTIPSVLSTMNDAKEKQLQNTADSVAEWYAKQYELATFASEFGTSVTTAYTNFPATATLTNFNDTAKKGKAALIAAGVSNVDTNIDLANSSVQLVGDKICIILTAKQGGSFYNSDTSKNTKKSSACS